MISMYQHFLDPDTMTYVRLYPSLPPPLVCFVCVNTSLTKDGKLESKDGCKIMAPLMNLHFKTSVGA